jgi:membrane-bound serine protease (ClpP class)
MEVKAPTHGALAVTGTILLIAGLLVLFNSPGTPEFLSISIPAAIAISGITALFFLFIVGKALSAQRAQPLTGVDGLIGQKGPVRTKLTSSSQKAPYSGTVLVAGELWQAQADEELSKDEQVIVTAVDGVTLQVTSTDN